MILHITINGCTEHLIHKLMKKIMHLVIANSCFNHHRFHVLLTLHVLHCEFSIEDCVPALG